MKPFILNKIIEKLFKFNFIKNVSFKKLFTSLEILTYILIVFILILFTVFSFYNEKKMTFDDQKRSLTLIDDHISNTLSQSINIVKNIYLDEHIEHVLTYFSDISEVFSIDNNFNVDKIYKKNTKSIVTEGISIKHSNLTNFIIQHPEHELFFTSISSHLIMNEPSFYIIKKLPDSGYLISNIDVSSIFKSVEQILLNKNSSIFITDENNYVLYSFNQKQPIIFFPDVKDYSSIKVANERYLVNFINIKAIKNKVYLITPYSLIYEHLRSTIVAIIIMILLVLILISIKMILTIVFLLNPLNYFAKSVSKWEIENLDLTLPPYFKGFSEVQSLMIAISNKSSEIAVSYEQLKEDKVTIQKYQKYISNLVDSLPLALFSIDLDGKILEWNKTAEQIIGLKKEDAISKHYLEIMPYLKNYQQEIKQVTTSGEMIEFTRQNFEMMENKLFNLDIIPISQNGFSGTAIILEDVSDKDKLERQLLQSQKMEIIGTLSGGIVHDFNNVLTGISSSISLIKYFITENSLYQNQELLEYIEMLESSTIRASEIVNRLLTLSKKHSIENVPTDLTEIILSVYKICKSTFDKSIEIELISNYDKAIILGDKSSLEQCVMNLCINASHAMTIMRPSSEKPGGKLTIKLLRSNETELPALVQEKIVNRINSENKKEDFWILSVSDTGVGIPEDKVDKIFEPFYTTKESYYGTGLGLSMVQLIVKEHKGFIEFESAPDVGTTFYIFFPVLHEKLLIETEPGTKTIKTGTGLILVIDDEEIIRRLTRQMLTKLGYNVLTASNGDEGLKIFKQFSDSIKIVLLDISMPGISAKETMKNIRKINPDVKILIISGLKNDIQTTEIIKQANGYLKKPFTIVELSGAIYNFLNRNKL
ncbi:MAG TPA: ATP-binding protein [Exilispira sp.]|nr:ATP-binding protein [Exilispira sp.]